MDEGPDTRVTSLDTLQARGTALSSNHLSSCPLTFHAFDHGPWMTLEPTTWCRGTCGTSTSKSFSRYLPHHPVSDL